MNVLGITGILLAALTLLVVVAGRILPDPANAKADLVAHNYAVLRNAANEAVSDDATITATTTRVIAATDASLTPYLPPYWNVLSQSGQARWKILVQSGLCYVYGAVSVPEMAAIRKRMRSTPTLAWYTGGALVPPINVQQSNGSLQPVTVPSDMVNGSVLSVITVVP